MSGRKRMDILLENKIRRQAVLDTLWATPLLSSEQLATAVNTDHKTMITTLTVMRRRDEIGATGGHHHTRYVAVAQVTVSAEELARAFGNRLQKKAADQRERAAKLAEARKRPEQWRTVYRSGINPEIARHQRGQGAIRARVHVNCQQHY